MIGSWPRGFRNSSLSRLRVVSEGVFRRLAVVTALFAYLQIALGGLVRVSGSGLGCPDWPLCHGRPYPPADLHAIIEYSHRAVGSVTGVLIIATVVMAWVVFRKRRPRVAWLASASLIGVVGEGVLGGVVVANELSPWLVVIHLGLAMMILGFLVATAVAAMPASNGVPDLTFRRLALLAVAATYLLLLTGSTVVASGADNSCNSWPLCGNGFTFDFAGANAFTMLHRGSVLAIGLLLLHVLSTAVRRWRSIDGLGPIAGAAMVVFVLQVAVGAGSALTGGALFDGLHVALATLVWAGVLATALLALPRADGEHELSRLAVDRRSA
jgi:heme A synthase